MIVQERVGFSTKTKDMIVYIVLFEVDYYPSTIEGIFATRRLAKDFIKTLPSVDDVFAKYNIEEHQVCDSK